MSFTYLLFESVFVGSSRVGHELGKSGEVGKGVNTYTRSGRGND